MSKGKMILGEDMVYSLDCHETKLNNNVLVVGAAGAGKTRSIVTPNILEATGSYVISDPKGNLYSLYGDYLREKGYQVCKLDFTDPENSCHYNFFNYIHNPLDIIKVAHMLVYQQVTSHSDPFWDQSSQLMVQACIAYLIEARPKHEWNLKNLMKLVACISPDYGCVMDRLIEDHEKHNKKSLAVQWYKQVKIAADRTLQSVVISVNAKLGLFCCPEIHELTGSSDLDITTIGKEKTAMFVVVSDTDRSLDPLANMFFTQTMNELCEYADKECKNNALPVPVRFILDDFATNCRIEEFPRMISSIRSRGISTMLMIQSEGQLAKGYGDDSETIIGNCDTYVFMGGNDIRTAENVAKRCDVPTNKILNMPVGKIWIMRRGQGPIQGTNCNLNRILRAKGLLRQGDER